MRSRPDPAWVPSPEIPPAPGQPHGVPDAVRLQILATEHWSLLATRGLIWNEIFSRATMYLTVLSGTVVAISFMAQATDFGEEFRLLALLLLPVVLIVGLGTFIRINDANGEDVGLVIGMNRLQRAYLEIAPDLEPYFVTSSHDDRAGIMLTYSADAKVQPSRAPSGTPILVGVINAVVAGVLAGMVCQHAGGSEALGLGIGVAVAVPTGALLAAIPLRAVARHHREHQPRFPTPAGPASVGPGPSPR